MNFKTIMSSILVAAGLATPMISSAKLIGPSLTIVNNTNFDSTSVINHGPCSVTVLGAGGITKAHSTNVISGGKLAIACITNKDNCVADVYMTNNCSGKKVASVVFSTNTGIKNFTVLDSSFQMQGSGFKAQIDGGA